MYRQGDILLVPVEERELSRVPAGAYELPGTIEVPRENGRIILARGEASGHAHAIEDPSVRHFRDREVHLFKRDDFISVPAPAVLRHEEHGPITIMPGVYRVVRQRQYVNGTGDVSD